MTTIIKNESETPTSEMMQLFDAIIGPGRFVRTAYRLREQATAGRGFGFNAFDADKLVGTVSLTPLLIDGSEGACLLGPLAVVEEYRCKGLGLELMQEGMAEAKKRGQKAIILIGDKAYYQRAGFTNVPHGKLKMPGPVDPSRLLVTELEEGSFTDMNGLVQGA